MVNRLTNKSLNILTITTLFFLANIAHAATVTTKITNNIIELGKSVKLTIKIDKPIRYKDIDLAKFEQDFQLSPPIVSSSYKNINGKSEIETTWQIKLTPKKLGKLYIPSINVGIYKTRQIPLNVIKKRQSLRLLQAQKDIIFRSRLEKKSIYEGEITKLNLIIFVGIPVRNLHLEAPYGDGVKVSKIGFEKTYVSSINGREYDVIEVSFQIEGLTSGKIKLHGATLIGEQVKFIKNLGLFEKAMLLPLLEQSQSIPLSVNSLPKSKIKSKLLLTNKVQLTQRFIPNLSYKKVQNLEWNQPIIRKISLKVHNINPAKLPAIKFDYGDTLKVYNEKPIFVTKGNITYMELKQVIYPQKLGRVSIPGYKLDWFNINTKIRQTSLLSKLDINILAKNKNQLSKDIKPIEHNKTNNVEIKKTSTLKNYNSIFWQWLFWIAVTFWIVTLVAFILWRKKVRVAKKNRIENLANLSQSEQISALISALKFNDCTKVLALYRLLNVNNFSAEAITKIEKELDLMIQYKYGNKNLYWENTKLIHLFNNLLKKSNKTHKN